MPTHSFAIDPPVEPMLAKRLLPALGGSPATWAACMLAFQLLLLAGYAYAHLGARYLDVRRQALLHLLLSRYGT